MVNLCVANWNAAIAKEKNPGIPHSEIAVPSEYASPVLTALLDSHETLEVDMPELFGVKMHRLQRIAKRVFLTCEGSLYYQAVRALAGATSWHPREIITEPTLYALSSPPNIVYVSDPSDYELDQKIPVPAKVYSYAHILKAVQRPSVVKLLWREFEHADSRAEQLELIVSMAEVLKPASGIREEDVALSVEEFYERGLRLPERQSKSKRVKTNDDTRSGADESDSEPRRYLPVLWSDAQEYLNLFRPRVLDVDSLPGLGQTKADDTAIEGASGDGLVLGISTTHADNQPPASDR